MKRYPISSLALALVGLLRATPGAAQQPTAGASATRSETSPPPAPSSPPAPPDGAPAVPGSPAAPQGSPAPPEAAAASPSLPPESIADSPATAAPPPASAAASPVPPPSASSEPASASPPLPVQPEAVATPPQPKSEAEPVEVTVVGTRSEQRLDESPAAVSVVTRRDLSKRYVPTFDDALKAQPGVWVLKYRGPVDNHGMTVMRGVYGQNRTQLMLDGIPINGVMSGEIPWSNFPVDAIDRIEIGRGPFSALYGGYAMAGVIDARTITPQTTSASLRFGYGTFETKSLIGTAGTRVLDDRLAVLVSVEHLRSDGYDGQQTRKSAGTTAATNQSEVTGFAPSTDVTGARQYVIGTPGKNPSTRTTAMTKLSYDLSPTSRLSLLGLYGEWTVDYPTFQSYLRDSGGNIVTSGQVNLDGNVSTVSVGDFMSVGRRQSAHLGGLRYETEVNRHLTLEVTSAITRQYSRELEYRVVPAAVNPDGRNWSPRENRSLGFYGGMNGIVRFNSSNTLTTGVSANAADGLQRVTLVPDRNQEDDIGTLSSVGGRQITGAVYAQHEVRPIDSIRLYGGARLDVWHNYDGFRRLPAEEVQTFTETVHFDARTQVSVNPKAAVVVLPAEGTTLRASAGTAFRPPTISELYGGSAHGGTQTFGDPSLDPERIGSVEIGAVQRLGRGTRLELSLFGNFISHMIFAKTISPAGASVTVKQYDNVGKARTFGAELAARQRIFSFLDLFGNYTYTHAKFTSFPSNPAVEGNWLPNVPRHLYNFGVDLHHGPASALVTVEGASDAFAREDNADKVNGVPQGLDPYTTLDAKIRYKAAEHLQLSLAAINITNERYWLSFGRNPGRTFFGEALFSM
jgi:iron complex outermembrane recepter protein